MVKMFAYQMGGHPFDSLFFVSEIHLGKTQTKRLQLNVLLVVTNAVEEMLLIWFQTLF